jgi:hypothetical protein
MRFFLGILGVIIFIVVIIVLIATHGTNKTAITYKYINLDSYNNSTSSLVQTTYGTLVGNERRVAIQVKVSQSERTINVLSTYDNIVISTESFGNTSSGFRAFLGAMQNAGYVNSRPTTQTNIFGICPLGNTFNYQLYGDKGVLHDTWSTSCSITDGTFNGNGSLIRQLFTLQISNYRDFTAKYPLAGYATY